MKTDAHTGQWLRAYAALGSIRDPVWRKIAGAVQQRRYPQGARIFRDGESCQYYLLVVEGSIQVQKTTRDGHEIVLYHVNAGQTCELTTSCMLGGEKYVADAVAMTPVHAVLLSKEQFNEAVLRSSDFRKFVYASLDKGVSELVSLIGTVAFVHVDIRLARYLVGSQDPRHLVRATHQDIARELGTAREVISRRLKGFERNGWVRLHRGRIELVDEPALRTIADPRV